MHNIFSSGVLNLLFVGTASGGSGGIDDSDSDGDCDSDGDGNEIDVKKRIKRLNA